MRNRLIAFLFLCVLSAPILADLSWESPLIIGDFKDFNYQGQTVRTSDGISIVNYSKLVNGGARYFLEAYSPTFQLLWSKNIEVLGSAFCITSDNKLFLTYRSVGGLFFQRFNLDGSAYDENASVVFTTSINNPLVQLFPDDNGGVHVFTSDGAQRRYQYVSATGNLAYALDFSLQSIIPDNGKVTKVSLLGDSSLVFAYTLHPYSGLVKVDTSMNVVFQYSYENASTCTFAGRPDGSLYVGLNLGLDFQIIAYNALGVAQYTIPNTLGWIKELYCSPDDKLLVIKNQYDQFIAGLIYNAEGVAQIPAGETVLATTVYPYPVPECTAYPDGSNGFFLIASTPIAANKKRMSVNHISNNGVLWTEDIVLSETKETFKTYNGYAANGSFHTYFSSETGTHTSLAYIMFTESGIAQTPYSTCNIITESEGNARHVQIQPIGSDRAIVFWLKGYQYGDSARYLQYNIATPNGTWLFNEPQNVLPNQISCSYQLLTTDDNKVIVLWRPSETLGITRAQLINENGNKLWENSGKALSIPRATSGSISYSFFEGYLYAATRTSQGIKVLCFYEGEPMWGTEGVIAATINPNYGGVEFSDYYIRDRTLFWVQYAAPNWGSMCFKTKLNENGTHCDGFNTYGSPIMSYLSYESWSEYHLAGVRVNDVIRSDNGFWFTTEVVLESNEVYEFGSHQYSYLPYLNFVSSQGSALINNVTASVNGNYCSYVDDNYFYVGKASSPGLTVAKYNLLGELVWMRSVLTSYDWFGGCVMSMNKLSDNEILIAGSTFIGNIHSATYVNINPDGMPYSAQDNRYYTTYNPYLSMSICSTNVGSYLLCSDMSGIYAEIRFKTAGLDPSSIESDTNSPARFNLSSGFPNPSRKDTMFKLELQDPGYAEMDVFNLRGQKVMHKELKDLPKGINLITWDGTDLKGKQCSNGVYFVRVNMNGRSQTAKIVRIK